MILILISDFILGQSIDSVYKDLRVIRASIQNANKMNAASQRIVEVIFYFILVCIVLAALGIDPIALFGGLAAWLVGISFMIGGASSKYFEGLLLVLNRKPYDIGDRIAVSGIENDVSGDGSSGWIVKDLDLFKTTVIFGTTGEEATYSNGSLADSRIINHNRSPKAVLNFLVRFGIDAPKEKVKAFAEAVEQYVKERPREWLAFTAFRLSAVQPDQGFVEYKVRCTKLHAIILTNLLTLYFPMTQR
jgi:small-conductance mechanosensitive channel